MFVFAVWVSFFVVWPSRSVKELCTGAHFCCVSSLVAISVGRIERFFHAHCCLVLISDLISVANTVNAARASDCAAVSKTPWQQNDAFASLVSVITALLSVWSRSPWCTFF